MADPIRIVVEYSASGELVIRQAINNLDGLRERVERLSAAGPLSSRALKLISEDAERVATAYHGRLATAFGVARNEANHLFDSIDRFGHRAFYGLIGVTAAASAGLYGLGSAFIKVNEDFAGLEITVKSSLQSAQAARRIRDEVAAITASSPLPFKDLGESTRNLITMPFSRGEIAKQISQGSLSDQQGFFRQSVELVEQMIAFRPDKEAKDAIYSIREALSGQFRSLIRRFDIPSTALSTTAGKSLKELSNDPDATFKAMKEFFGRIITPDAIQELIRQPRFLFQNAMEQIFHIPLLKVGDYSYNAIVDQLTSLYNRITAFTKDKFDGYARKIGESVKSVFTSISTAGSKTAEFVLEKAGFSQSQFMGETQFERGARLVTSGFDSLARNLPKLMNQGAEFFEKIRPLLERLYQVVSLLGKAFLSFADFSPTLTLLAVFFRRAILEGLTFGMEGVTQRLTAGMISAVAQARAVAAAPNLKGVLSQAVSLGGFESFGLGKDKTPFEIRAARKSLFDGLVRRIQEDSAVALASTRGLDKDLLAKGAGFVGSAPAYRMNKAGDFTAVTSKIRKGPLDGVVYEDSSRGGYAFTSSSTTAQRQKILDLLGHPSAASGAGHLLPNQKGAKSLMVGWENAVAAVAAQRAAAGEALSQLAKAESELAASQARASAPKPKFFSSAGIKSRLGELTALGAGAGTAAAGMGATFASIAIPMAAVAGLIYAITRLTDSLEKNARMTEDANSRFADQVEKNLGGSGARSQLLLNSRGAADSTREMLMLANADRAKNGLAALDAPRTSVAWQTMEMAQRTKTVTLYPRSGAVQRQIPYGDPVLTPFERTAQMTKEELLSASEQAAQDAQRIVDWEKSNRKDAEGNEMKLRLPSFPKVIFRESDTPHEMERVRKLLVANQQAFLAALMQQNEATGAMVPSMYFRPVTAGLAPEFQEAHEALRSRAAKMFGEGFYDYFKELGKEGKPGFAKGTLSSAKELMSGYQLGSGESYQESYDAFEKRVDSINRPFKAELNSLDKALKVHAENAKVSERVEEAITKRTTEFDAGLVRFKADYDREITEWNRLNFSSAGTYGRSIEGASLRKSIESRYQEKLADPKGAMLRENAEKFRVAQAETQADALRAFSVGMAEVSKNRSVFLPNESDQFLSGVSGMMTKLNEFLAEKFDVSKLVEKARAAIPNPEMFGEEKENENVRALNSLAGFYKAVQLQLAKNSDALGDEARKSWAAYEALAAASGRDPSKLFSATEEEMKKWTEPERLAGQAAKATQGRFRQLQSQLSTFSGLAEEASNNAGRATLGRAAEARYNELVQARESLPQFFRRLPELSAGPEGEHALAELRNALTNLKWDGLLNGISDLSVFLKDASGPDHLAVMADKYREMLRLLPAVNEKLEEELRLQRAAGLEQTAKKTEASLRAIASAQENAFSKTLEYFTQGLERELNQVSKGVDDSFAREAFPKQLMLLGDRLPGADFSSLEGMLSGSLVDQTLPSEQLQQARDVAANFRIRLAKGLVDIAQRSVDSLADQVELAKGMGPEGEDLLPGLRKTLDEVERTLKALQNAAQTSQSALQREFVTRQRLYADQALKAAQGAITNDLQASLNVRPGQIGRFQLADLERHVREAGLEGQIDTRKFLADSTGPENLGVLLDKQRWLDSTLSMLADRFEELAVAAEKAFKSPLPAGFHDVGNGFAYNPDTDTEVPYLSSMDEANRFRGLSRSAASAAEQERRSREEVNGTGMLDSLGRGFRGVTERFREEAQNFKSIGADIASSLQSNLGNAFADFITGTKSASQAFADFGKSILNEVARIFANKAAAQLIGFATQAVFGMFATAPTTSVGGGGGGGDYGSYGNVGAATPNPGTFAAGGFIKGGSGVRDDVPALLMGGEYVVRRTAVDRYGEEFLNALNQSRLQIEPDGSTAGFAASVQQKAIADAVMPRRLVSEALEPELVRRATGGMIFGGSGVRDDVPAMLMGGEFVVRRSAVERYGQDFMEALNTGAVIRRAEGGRVPYPSTAPVVWQTPDGQPRAEPVHISAPVSQEQTSYGDSQVNITIHENGTVSEESKGQKQGQYGDNKEFGRMLKNAVLEVMNTQRRPGGAWRNA